MITMLRFHQRGRSEQKKTYKKTEKIWKIKKRKDELIKYHPQPLYMKYFILKKYYHKKIYPYWDMNQAILDTASQWVAHTAFRTLRSLRNLSISLRTSWKEKIRVGKTIDYRQMCIVFQWTSVCVWVAISDFTLQNNLSVSQRQHMAACAWVCRCEVIPFRMLVWSTRCV